MKYRGKNGPRSSAVLAHLLDSEGFSDHVANQVEGYWRRTNTHKNFAHIEVLKRGVTELCKKLTDDDKKVLGRFVSLHMRMGFDTGLRMGLAVRLVREPDTTQPRQRPDGAVCEDDDDEDRFDPDAVVKFERENPKE